MTPSSLGAIRLIAGMNLRQTRRGGTIWLTVSLLVLVIASALVALVSGNGNLDSFNSLLAVYVRYLTPFIMVLHGSGAVAEEVREKTISYIFSRPIPRWSLPMGKYLGSLILGFTLMFPSLILTYVINMLGETDLIVEGLPRLGYGVVALTLAIILFGAIATAFGTMVTSFSFVAALIYILVVELSFSFVPGWFKAVAMTTHLQVIAGVYRPKKTMFMSDPSLTRSISLAAVLGEIILWVIVAATWVKNTEYRTDK